MIKYKIWKKYLLMHLENQFLKWLIIILVISVFWKFIWLVLIRIRLTKQRPVRFKIPEVEKNIWTKSFAWFLLKNQIFIGMIDSTCVFGKIKTKLKRSVRLTLINNYVSNSLKRLKTAFLSANYKRKNKILIFSHY